jgi:pyruvate dehydrogenase E2 component (dihydrolipoamide acetyltransferase)
MEVECFEDGVLLKQYCGAGDEVPVGGAIAAIGEAGEAAPEVAPAEAAAASPEPQAEAAPEPTPVTPAPAVATPAPAPPAPAVPGAKIKASPLAKKLAADKGLDLATIQGSGPSGRIVKADVLNAKPGSRSAGPAAPGLETLSIPVTNMRKSIARALVGSKTQAPHFYLQIEVDGAPLAAFRKALNAKYADLPAEQGGMKFSVNDLTLKAAAEAIRKVPVINRSWEGESITQHGNVHLAFGVAIDDGLLTPVIREAENKSLHQISGEAKSLIKKAREKKLSPEEMSGSTLTVTNLGMFGISDFYGIINPNNAAILSIGATLKKPVVNEHDQIVIGQTMKVGLSGDHRTIDGAVGAQYLQALKEILENPALMLI